MKKTYLNVMFREKGQEVMYKNDLVIGDNHPDIIEETLKIVFEEIKEYLDGNYTTTSKKTEKE